MRVVTIVLPVIDVSLSPLTTLQNPVNRSTLSANKFLPIYNAAVPRDNLVSRRRKDFFRLPIVDFPCPTLSRSNVPKERAPVFILSQHFRVSDHDQQGLRPCDGHLQSTSASSCYTSGEHTTDRSYVGGLPRRLMIYVDDSLHCFDQRLKSSLFVPSSKKEN